MSEVFNSSLEISLRILIILNTVKSRLSVDRITALDFISIYGKDFGSSEYSKNNESVFFTMSVKSSAYLSLRDLQNIVPLLDIL